MRIFIGLTEISNIAYTYSEAFRALGHETYKVIRRRNKYYPSSSYDLVLEDGREKGPPQTGIGKLRRRLRRFARDVRIFIGALRRCDVFIFIFGTSFLPHHLDYPILKLMGKRIVSVFCGSDIRYVHAFAQEMRHLGLADEFRELIAYYESLPTVSFRTMMSRVRAAERYADLILSQPSLAQLQSRPYMRFNFPINLEGFRFNVPARARPLILHAPSNRRIKGTEHVLSAVDALSAQGKQFEFALIEGVPNDEVREMLADSDIVVDQLHSLTVAGLAVEAMATGNAVLARHRRGYAGIPDDCPVVNVTPSTLVSELGELISDVPRRAALARAGRAYVEKYHAHLAVARQILGWLEPHGIKEYDFKPEFFTRYYRKPVEAIRSERRNTWRRFVRRAANLMGISRKRA
jgi:glycosyltransferase involved in cell wall biosynthesis